MKPGFGLGRADDIAHARALDAAREQLGVAVGGAQANTAVAATVVSRKASSASAAGILAPARARTHGARLKADWLGSAAAHSAQPPGSPMEFRSMAAAVARSPQMKRLLGVGEEGAQLGSIALRAGASSTWLRTSYGPGTGMPSCSTAAVQLDTSGQLVLARSTKARPGPARRR